MGALLAFVLPTLSAGTTSMIPERLAGWWMASVAGTASVAIPTRAMWIGERLRDLRYHLADTIGPALELSALGHRPWWR